LREAGYRNPVLEANLTRDGRRIVATASGIKFDAETGQLLLQLVQQDAATYLNNRVIRADFSVVSRALTSERRSLRRRPSATKTGWRVEIAGGSIP
jgi:hypothetical protein